MASSHETRMPPAGEFAGVFKLVNCYVAIHDKKDETVVLSEHLEIDIRLAQATAKAFAQTHNIHYDGDLYQLNKPLITVLKRGEEWYPVELHTDKANFITHFGPLKLGGTQEEATNMANVIANYKGTDCIPSIGISLYPDAT